MIYRVTKGQFCGAFVSDANDVIVIEAAPFLRRLTVGLTPSRALDAVLHAFPRAKINIIKEN